MAEWGHLHRCCVSALLPLRTAPGHTSGRVGASTQVLRERTAPPPDSTRAHKWKISDQKINKLSQVVQLYVFARQYAGNRVDLENGRLRSSDIKHRSTGGPFIATGKIVAPPSGQHHGTQEARVWHPHRWCLSALLSSGQGGKINHSSQSGQKLAPAQLMPGGASTQVVCERAAPSGQHQGTQVAEWGHLHRCCVSALLPLRTAPGHTSGRVGASTQVLRERAAPPPDSTRAHKWQSGGIYTGAA